MKEEKCILRGKKKPNTFKDVVLICLFQAAVKYEFLKLNILEVFILNISMVMAKVHWKSSTKNIYSFVHPEKVLREAVS